MVWPETEQVPAAVQVLWLVKPEIEQVPAPVQALWLVKPDTEHEPALVQALWVMLPEIEQDDFVRQELRGLKLPRSSAWSWQAMLVLWHLAVNGIPGCVVGSLDLDRQPGSCVRRTVPQ